MSVASFDSWEKTQHYKFSAKFDFRGRCYGVGPFSQKDWIGASWTELRFRTKGASHCKLCEIAKIPLGFKASYMFYSLG